MRADIAWEELRLERESLFAPARVCLFAPARVCLFAPDVALSLDLHTALAAGSDRFALV